MRIFFALLCLVPWLAFGGSPTNETTVKLCWNYTETNEYNMFRIYWTTNVADPKPWKLLTNVVGTNFSVPLVVYPRVQFFYATVSNLWLESLESEICTTPDYPTNFTIRVGK